MRFLPAGKNHENFKISGKQNIFINWTGKVISLISVQVYYFQKEPNFQFLSIFYPKTFVAPIWNVIESVAAVFLLTKLVSKFNLGHFLDKRWKVEFGFMKLIVKIIHQHRKIFSKIYLTHCTVQWHNFTVGYISCCTFASCGKFILEYSSRLYWTAILSFDAVIKHVIFYSCKVQVHFYDKQKWVWIFFSQFSGLFSKKSLSSRDYLLNSLESWEEK